MRYTKNLGECPRMGCDEAIICVYRGDEAYIIDHDRACAKRPLKEKPKDG